MKTTWSAAIAACGWVAAQAWAQVAVVEAIHEPAWITRGGGEERLAPGMRLDVRDGVRTGKGGRARLRLAEDSAVKLGERAGFLIERAEIEGTFRATLTVLAGAFRFTTDAAAPAKPREIAVKAKQVTIGLRGTDFWGRVGPDEDFVVLLEGRIQVSAQGHPPVTLAKAGDLYAKPRDGKPALSRAHPATLAAWAAETEIP